MSLFGDLPDSTPSKTRNSGLFDDDIAAANKSGTNLFADDLAGSQESPWALPTPKKAARSQLIKNLLPTSQVPDSYIDAFDSLLPSNGTQKGEIGVEGVKKLLADSSLSSDMQSKIFGIVLPGEKDAQALGRNEFNVLLALIGLAQEGEEVTLDGVDERRRDLPQPRLPSLTASKPKPEAAPSTPQRKETEQPSTYATPAAQPPNTSSLSKNKAMNRKQSFGLESDPWASPELHRNHNHSTNNTSRGEINGVHPTNPTAPQRTTSAFTTTSTAPTDSGAQNPSSQQPSVGSYGAGWAGYNGSSTNSFRDSGLGGGFGDNPSGSGEDGRDPTGLAATLGASRIAHNGNEEVITITTIPEMEGTLFFQHRNYQVTSSRRNTTVIRRYSDFVWLLDCLHKRYPFRQLPLLPPKRVAINGNHIAADASFVEKRRRGLSRFANALVRHPVLGQEQLVVMFLTVPTELSVWRKQATISVQDEFQGRSLPPNLEDSLPTNLQELFDRVRSGVKRGAEIYINLCGQVERLAKRKEGLAAEYQRCGTALMNLTEVMADTYAADPSDVPPLNAGLGGTAKHLNNAQNLLVDETRAWDEGVLEDLKKQRDVLVSMRDMFDRRDRLDKDEIPKLERRIKNNEEKLRTLSARPEGVGKPGDVEKVEEAIFRDKEAIVAAHARHVFIKECIRDEILFFQQTQYAVSRLHQDWASERVKYAELLAENWRAASEEVEGMPTGD